MADICAATDDFKAIVSQKEQVKELEALAKAFADLAGSCTDFLSTYEYYAKQL